MLQRKNRNINNIEKCEKKNFNHNKNVVYSPNVGIEEKDLLNEYRIFTRSGSTNYSKFQPNEVSRRNTRRNHSKSNINDIKNEENGSRNTRYSNQQRPYETDNLNKSVNIALRPSKYRNRNRKVNNTVDEERISLK